MDQHDSVLNLRKWAEKAKAGDRAAFEQLVVQYEARLLAGLERKLPPGLRARAEAEEILQETFCRAFQAIERFEWRGEESVYLWLYGIGRNVIREQAKKLNRREGRLEPDLVPADDASPSRALRRGERFSRLEGALSKLKPEYQEALRLARVDGLKVRDIAHRMGRSENSVKHLMARAILELRKLFGETESLHLPDRAFEDWDGQNEER